MPRNLFHSGVTLSISNIDPTVFLNLEGKVILEETVETIFINFPDILILSYSHTDALTLTSTSPMLKSS